MSDIDIAIYDCSKLKLKMKKYDLYTLIGNLLISEGHSVHVSTDA